MKKGSVCLDLPCSYPHLAPMPTLHPSPLAFLRVFQAKTSPLSLASPTDIPHAFGTFCAKLRKKSEAHILSLLSSSKKGKRQERRERGGGRGKTEGRAGGGGIAGGGGRVAGGWRFGSPFENQIRQFAKATTICKNSNNEPSTT